MKKNKEIKYSKDVPQSIVDLMGVMPYKYINSYNTYYWDCSKLSKPDILRSTVEEKINVHDMSYSVTLESFISNLENYKNAPDYISGMMEVDYDYDYTNFYLVITKKRHLSEKEQIEYDKIKIEFDREREVYERLQEVIKKEVKNKKQAKMLNDKIELQKKIAKLEAEAKELKLKL